MLKNEKNIPHNNLLKNNKLKFFDTHKRDDLVVFDSLEIETRKSL
jgi:hypothetical protein